MSNLSQIPFFPRVFLVIGYGSIGARHARVLSAMGYRVGCVTRRKDSPFPSYSTIQAALEAEHPDVVAICTPTSVHLENCKVLEQAGFTGRLFLEKPLFETLPAVTPVICESALIGYNLRFHPVIQSIREILIGKKIYSAQFSVGQYLPAWRPQTDYRNGYSAKIAEGGGVLRDLSHELDLALWLFGSWNRVTAICGKWGDLEIETEDTVDILASLENCPSLTIHLDYHNLFPRRVVSIQADGLSLEADLIGNTLRVNDSLRQYKVVPDDTYIAEWQDILSATPQCACTLAEGVEVMHFIAAVENSSRNGKWEARQ